ncbi:carbon-nitrogen hydrolase family protein [Pseudomonas huanghezhanensis]|uniref:carbon-nitrogen hydrolase family protein n=1 Tax=Pseudomonas huanghezhanensis TaxID=3002903 RepID=UPI0022856B2C|nr:carbon-nitrogen hydrolase family protein [Pseudomonas sp. BSw22131]
MNFERFAVAQIVVEPGDLQANVLKHLCFMRQAARRGVSFLLFPELSLTGYEPELARELAIDANDVRLQPLSDLAAQHAMLTVVGVPLRDVTRVDIDGQIQPDILIAALTLGPQGHAEVYTKQYLHPGEERVFSVGNGGTPLIASERRISLAVCADFTHEAHVRRASLAAADVYAVSALISKNGYATDTAMLAGYALKYRMLVMMANYGGQTGGWQSAGRSAVWAQDGRQLAAVEGEGDCLLIASCEAGQWSAFVEPLSV